MSFSNKWTPFSLVLSGIAACLTAPVVLGDRSRPMEPAGEVEFGDDGTAPAFDLATSSSKKKNSPRGRFSVAQGDEIAPPEPKIKVPGDSDPGTTGDSESNNAGLDDLTENWDSYTDRPEELAADDVSPRIRVEDIVEPPSEYRFATFGKEDPFVPPLIAQEVNSLEVPIISPLQRHPLSAMGLTGVWGGAEGQRKALVTVRDFSRGILGIVVKVGDPIGNSGGKVVAINKDGMSVREFRLAPDGARIYEDRFLMLGENPPIPIVSGNLVFRPGDSGGVVADPIDRATARGIVVDPDGIVYDQLWQTGDVRSLKVEPAAPSTLPPVGAAPQGPLPGAASPAGTPTGAPVTGQNGPVGSNSLGGAPQQNSMQPQQLQNSVPFAAPPSAPIPPQGSGPMPSQLMAPPGNPAGTMPTTGTN